MMSTDHEFARVGFFFSGPLSDVATHIPPEDILLQRGVQIPWLPCSTFEEREPAVKPAVSAYCTCDCSGLSWLAPPGTESPGHP
jgi:hypothetical protein